MNEYDATYVCQNCIGDKYLAMEVRESGCVEICDHCLSSNEAWSVERLAERIRDVLDKYFEPVSESVEAYENAMIKEKLMSWMGREGYEVLELVSDIGLLEIDIAEEIVVALAVPYHRAVRDGAINPYERDARYVKRDVDFQDYLYLWDEYRHEILYGSRFFSRPAEELLDGILGNISSSITNAGMPVIQEIGPGTDQPFVWRARMAKSKVQLETIFESPVSQLGPPPPESATPGRMNPQGIRVFYGALEKDTCVSEIRALVGSFVVVGRFELLRDVKILDFDVLAQVSVPDSYFHPKYAESTSRAAFFRWLTNEISRPVLPDDEASEYIPFQALAEYLVNKVEGGLDGIIYRSSQTKGQGRNVVLFNHASGIDPSGMAQGSDFDVRIYQVPTDDEGTEKLLVSMTQKERPKLEEEAPKHVKGRPLHLEFSEKKPERFLEPHLPTLRLDLQSLAFFPIEGLKYRFGRSSVNIFVDGQQKCQSSFQ